TKTMNSSFPRKPRNGQRLASALSLSATLVLQLFFSSTIISRAQNPAPPARTEPAAAQRKSGEPASERPGDKDLQGGRKTTREGVTIEMSAQPLPQSPGKPVELTGNEDAVISFKITDSATGNPLSGLRPAAWLSLRNAQQTTAKDCREKIQAFLQASLAARPTLDLNSYYVLALNREPTISVIDPMLGYGTTKLLTLVFLNNPGEDWVQSKDGKRIYVTMPASNQVAVVDTVSFKVTANVTTGIKPSRIALQNDQKYVWVSCLAVPEANNPAGVSVLDTATNKVVSSIQTGPGDHDIVFSADDRFAFVSNSTDGVVSVIDVPKLALIKSIKAGKTVTSMAYSPLSNAVYVADGSSGTISVIDARLHEVVSTINLAPGLGMVRFTGNGRIGVVVNSRENTASVFDAATNQLIQRLEVEPGPDQISFTSGYAYIRSMKSDHVSLIPLAGLEKGGSVQSVRIPGGQAAPDRSGPGSLALSIVPAPEGGSVLISNPTDKTIYYYSEGMAAPMGSFQNYKREPRAVTVVDKSIRETAPGVYSVTVRLPEAGGDFDVPFLLDSPRVIYCFDLAIKPGLEYAKKKSAYPLKVNFLLSDTRIPVRQKATLRFKLLDPQTNQPRAGLKDVGVLTFLAPGTWQERQWASQVGEGIYEISFVPPEHGVYYVFIECPSLKVKLNELPYMILDAREQKETGG
ncbi:MAG TPA: YncE family protein, partial [Blastocatellia bacterium]|nr:YncE family protein [Blastocatellia bacterium]